MTVHSGVYESCRKVLPSCVPPSSARSWVGEEAATLCGGLSISAPRCGVAGGGVEVVDPWPLLSLPPQLASKHTSRSGARARGGLVIGRIVVGCSADTCQTGPESRVVAALSADAVAMRASLLRASEQGMGGRTEDRALAGDLQQHCHGRGIPRQ